MMTKLRFRGLCIFGFATCAVGIAFALYLQHAKGLEPCPLCVFQRIAMICCGLGFLLAAVIAPKNSVGRWAYAGLPALIALMGSGISGRQVWLQSLPPDRVPSCGPPLDYLMAIMPLRRVIAYVLKGDGSCAKVDAQWLGLTLPVWTLLAFVALALFALFMPRLSRGDRL